ncbi:Cyclo(L-tyrosyl-L-tyrosyl) synthase [Mycobacterium simulans]|uniref:tRNA-dependent cyclodipeptide synthase n=1 Tax=Mycobacterium simulans TaxID=627089 RepID=UPI00174A8F7C|nr:tRNA-dependent cyclodipeptide synthase [Mycobacterium simulans]SON62021.1 Cyclo(L-tyrosyl-L-tyrosyl) synthase [Mycobacterium simulans]
MPYMIAEPDMLTSAAGKLQCTQRARAAQEIGQGTTRVTKHTSQSNPRFQPRFQSRFQSRFQLGRHVPKAVSQEGFLVQPFTQHCHVIHTEGDHAVIGISPGNSYFSRERIRDLGVWGLTNFDRVDFVYTDVHVAESYEALGDSAIEARRKAVKNIRGVRAKIAAAVDELDPTGTRLSVRPMSEFQSNEAYRELHADLLARLDDDEDFRAVCKDLVRRFLSTKVVAQQGPTATQEQVCMDYICAEAPLFLDTPAILGVPSSLNCYHQSLPMAEMLYARGSGLRASRNQGHAIVTPDGSPTV